MVRKTNILRLICGLSGVALLMAMPACSSDDMLDELPLAPDVPAASDSVGERKLVLRATDYKGDWHEGTRMLTSLPDVLQKQIHNVYYFFYDQTDYLEKIYYQGLKTPVIELEVNLNDFKDEDGNTPVTPDGKVLLIVNSQSMQHTATAGNKPELVSSTNINKGEINRWRQKVGTYNNFRKESLFPLFFPSSITTEHVEVKKHGRPNHIIMFGYFDGTMDHSTMQVPLGRVVARMRFALSGAGLGQQARITIKNAPIQTPIFTEAIEEMKNAFYSTSQAAKDSCWCDYEEMIDNQPNTDGEDDGTVGTDGYRGGITGTVGNYKANVVYYCGENNWHYTGIKTILRIETWDDLIMATPASSLGAERGYYDNGVNSDEPDRVYEMELAHDSPGITGDDPNAIRDYSIYYNTSYTFNLTLKNSAEASTRSVERNADGTTVLYPVNK